MIHLPSRGISASHRLLTLLLAAVVASCGSGPQQQDTDLTAPPVEEFTEAGDSIVLDLPPSALRAEFNAVERTLASFNWMQAGDALDSLPEELADPNDRAYRDYLRARITYLRGNQERALALLAQARELSISDGLRYRIATFQHFVLSTSGDDVSAARIATGMIAWLPRDHASVWRRSAWKDLQRASLQDIMTELASATDPDWIGWLQLAQDTMTGDGSPRSLGRWLSQYPNHPATNPLPGGMGYAVDRAAPSGSVALLLPLSGRLAPAGKAVLEGYLAAHYERMLSGVAQAELIVLDEARYPSASEAYDEAVQRGAHIVIGPLSKSSVAELAIQPQRPVPVLALNRVEEVLPATGAALVQLSLSPDDEATTLAAAAFGRGARSALVIRPTGDWGDKVEMALRKRWRELGGTVAGASSYSQREEYSDSVKTALGLTDSEGRARQVRDMLATNIEFTPRRRGDADIIFLLSRNSAEARSIKPLLAFHYAGDIPVYALSSIHSGRVEQGNRDLEGTNLVEIPWLLGANPELRVAIASGDTGSDNYTRLNALGADAYLIQSNFSVLQSGPNALFRGSTGLLSLDSDLHIRRELSLAVFDGGVVEPQ